MSHELRYRLHDMVDRLPGDRLDDVLCFVEMLVTTSAEKEVDLEESWLLASGAFKVMVRADSELPTVIGP